LGRRDILGLSAGCSGQRQIGLCLLLFACVIGGTLARLTRRARLARRTRFARRGGVLLVTRLARLTGFALLALTVAAFALALRFARLS
ncbi:hypothetical protein NK983_30275, partial [Salmonella enterica subsp. enterica serovar Typhimurium]|nr:hypothetical protein [Salmonella enterica subsp. enterica serovar Typhimurium]